MNHIVNMIFLGYAALFVMQTILWAVQTRTKNASTADVGWSIGMLLIAVWYALNLQGDVARKWLIILPITLWCARLSWFLIWRTVMENREDTRYARFREQWKTEANQNFFMVYQLQPLFNLILSIPFFIVLSNPDPNIHFIEIIGVILWVVGFAGESLADYQLSQFKAKPENAGKICQEGLWGYSRHPNFFFEWFMWVAYFVVALGSPGGFWAIIAPAFMLFLLMKVTGIPVIEKYALAKKGEPFREYMNTTSFFVPMPRKK